MIGGDTIWKPGTKTVGMSADTHKRLTDLTKKGESYEETIIKLLDYYQETAGE